MKKLVVYYSLHGSTRTIAELIAQKEKAELLELKETTKRNGLWGFIKSGYQARKKKKSHIQALPVNLFEDKDEIIIATPIWASLLPPAINAFLEQVPWRGHKVSSITVQANPDHKGAEKDAKLIKEFVEHKGATYLKNYAFTGAAPGKTLPKEEFEKQVNEIYSN